MTESRAIEGLPPAPLSTEEIHCPPTAGVAHGLGMLDTAVEGLFGPPQVGTQSHDQVVSVLTIETA
jgi:hypothetical protein